MRHAKAVLVLAVVLLIATSAPSIAASLDDPYEIFNRYFEAIGGLDKLKAEKTSYTEGTIEILGTGLKGSMKQWNEMPAKLRQDIDLGIINQVSGDNGEIQWAVDANGKVTIIRDEDSIKRRRLKLLSAEFDFLDKSSENFKLTFDGIKEADGQNCYVVTTTNTINNDISHTYFDTATFMMTRQVDSTGDNTAITRFSDYRPAGDIIRPYKVAVENRPIPQNINIEFTVYRANIEIDPALFEPPADDVEDFHFTSGFSAENIPFEYMEEHIFLPVIVNGSKRLWALDSGAGKSVIDITLADELGLAIEGNIQGAGAGNAVELSFVDLPPASLPGIELDEQTIMAADFLKPLMNKYMGVDAIGILGYDFLSRFVTRIDYANRTISLYHPDHFEYDGPGKILSAPLTGNIFTVKATVDDKYTGNWGLDLGAGSSSFHYPFSEENGFLDRDGVDRVARGAGGEFTVRACRFDNIEFGGFTLEKPRIDITVANVVGAFRNAEKIGNLGNELFRNFVLYLDYNNQQIIVEKGGNFGRDFPRDRSGVQILMNDSGEIEINHIAARTPGEKAGLKKGDILKTIDGRDAFEFGGMVNIRTLFRGEAGTTYRLGIDRNGKEKEFPLTLKELL